MEEEDEFDPPPVTNILKQILNKYPDGGQILKVQHLGRICTPNHSYP